MARILPDAALRGYLQRITGLSLLGAVNGDKELVPIGYGEGANGKTKFREAVCHALAGADGEQGEGLPGGRRTAAVERGRL